MSAQSSQQLSIVGELINTMFAYGVCVTFVKAIVVEKGAQLAEDDQLMLQTLAENVARVNRKSKFAFGT